MKHVKKALAESFMFFAAASGLAFWLCPDYDRAALAETAAMFGPMVVVVDVAVAKAYDAWRRRG